MKLDRAIILAGDDHRVLHLDQVFALQLYKRGARFKGSCFVREGDDHKVRHRNSPYWNSGQSDQTKHSAGRFARAHIAALI